ncbi:MAG TPA: ABC transporter ATP-binding protein [Caldilineae bacterium]|jgi:ABC-type sugar transport system ATPase subunit|nr:ABC transporter ATP-binding protein [Caldilineae bacterium]
MRVLLKDLRKEFGNVVAVNDLNLEIEHGEFVSLLGPSGCGKTTTLLMVAGIYKPTSGYIYFGDRIVNELPPKDRNIGMVFQSYALYPHMTVLQNITFPLELKKVPKEERIRRAQKVAEMMRIGDLMDRKPAQLSGGQQQRVALCRALVKEPDILLFDEPLSNLDAKLRVSMRGEIKRLQRDLGITAIYVTHDQVEAMTMADRIAVMNQGQLQAFMTPDDIYNHPPNLFVAEFIGNPPMNFLEGSLRAEDGGLTVVGPGFSLRLPDAVAARLRERNAPQEVILGIRPEDIYLDSQGEISAEIYLIEPLGRDDLLDCRLDHTRLQVLVPTSFEGEIGDRVSLRFDLDKLQIFDPKTEKSLLWM